MAAADLYPHESIDLMTMLFVLKYSSADGAD